VREPQRRLWYRLKPTQTSPLGFSYGDRIVSFAAGNGQPVFGAHLVWDEGLGDGWPPDQLYNLSTQEARDILFGTILDEVAHYAGKMKAWSVTNEMTDGRRKDAERLLDRRALQPDDPSDVRGGGVQPRASAGPNALLVIKDFWMEADADSAARRASMLKAIGWLTV
jgi:endo-1,4-beta-xylanase